MNFFKHQRQVVRLSERAASARLGISRLTLRAYERDYRSVKLSLLEKAAALFGHKILLAPCPSVDVNSELSTVAVSYNVDRDGFDSWKIHYFNLVDEFRQTHDIRLLLLPPISSLDERLLALMASIVYSLCNEAGLETPDWAAKENFLPSPWFVSGVNSLKATALLESPYEFRRNNIFVQSNILMRA